MKVLYLILLVAVALEASLSMWPDSFVEAADGGETVMVKPATKKAAAATVAPAQPVPSVQQPAAPPAQPINNEVHVKPAISVHVAPQQQQDHPQVQPSQPVVHVQTPAHPDAQQIVIQKPQQQPIVELPDDDGDDNDDDDKVEVDDDEERQVKAEHMQIVPYEAPEQRIVPVGPHRNEIQIVPHGNPLSQLIKSADLLPTEQMTVIDTGNDNDTNTGVVQIDGAELTDDSNNNDIFNANIINRRYHPIGWQPSKLDAVQMMPGFHNYQADQLPVIQVNIDEQIRRPWLATAAAPAPVLVQSPQLPYSMAGPYYAAPAAAPTWQQSASGFYSASPVGAALANVYQAPAVYSAADPIVEASRVRGYYGGMGTIGQPMMQAPMQQLIQSPMMMAPTMVQQQPIMMQPVMMQMPIMQQQPIRIKSKKQKKRKQPEVVVEVEEKPKKVVEVKPEEPEEMEWETVRIPKRKTNVADAVAAGQH